MAQNPWNDDELRLARLVADLGGGLIFRQIITGLGNGIAFEFDHDVPGTGPSRSPFLRQRTGRRAPEEAGVVFAKSNGIGRNIILGSAGDW